MDKDTETELAFWVPHSETTKTSLHWGDGGWKAIFPLFEANKTWKNPGLRQSVSTHFVADCSFVSTPTKNECNTQIAIWSSVYDLLSLVI